MSNFNNGAPRYFVNTYPDFDRNNHPTSLNELVDSEFWTEFIRTASKICMEKLNTYEQKRCENGIYSGNLGLIFMAYKLLKCGRFSGDEINLKRYMYECLKSNEEFHYYNNIEYTKDIGLLTGKGRLIILPALLKLFKNKKIKYLGGLYLMGVIVSKTIGLELNAVNYANSYNFISTICRPVYFLDTGADEMFVG